MNGRLLLDTNAVIALWNHNPSISALLKAAEHFAVPSLVLGELNFGALGSERPDSNWAQVAGFVMQVSVLACDATTAEYYGRIRDGLRRKGRPIPQNDIWIAAMAQQYQLTLVTRDSHFDVIENLSVTSW